MSSDCKVFALAIGLALVCLTTHAASASGLSATDGNGLLSNCEAFLRMAANYEGGGATSSDDSLNGAFCSGYVMGAIDDHVSIQMNDKSPLDPKRFCLPDGVTPHQTIRVIAKWLEDHPARLHERAIGLVLTALGESFPCRQSQ
jgi:hypothetical protein